MKQMDLLPRQLVQDLLVAGRRRDDYRSLQNVLMTQCGRHYLFSAPDVRMHYIFFVKIQLDCFSAGSRDVFSMHLLQVIQSETRYVRTFFAVRIYIVVWLVRSIFLYIGD